jgi:hypothetical protein
MKMKRRPTGSNGQGGKDGGNTLSITRVVALVDFAALLADDLATLAAQSGRAHDACAATHLSQAAHHAWRAAEALAEGVAP